MKKLNILCVIPARGGSKRLKNKNIRLLCGKPVIGYAIDSAKMSRSVDKIVVSTDDPKISRVARKYNIQAIKRPAEYSTDTSAIEEALRHAVEYLRDNQGYLADIIVWIQANVPIRKKGQIDKVIQKLISTGADSAVTVYQVSQYPLWMKKMDKQGFIAPVFSGIKEYRAQDVEPLFLLDGAIVVMQREALMSTKGKSGAHIYLGKKTVGIIQERKYTIEIDDKEDLDSAEFYLSRQENRLRR